MLATPPETISSHSVSTHETLGGRPRIAGHRIAIAQVAAWRLCIGMNFVHISATYDHKPEIDAREQEDDALADKMKAKMGSKLADKLAAAKPGQ